jgi:hypothetical protein
MLFGYGKLTITYQWVCADFRAQKVLYAPSHTLVLPIKISIKISNVAIPL